MEDFIKNVIVAIDNKCINTSKELKTLLLQYEAYNNKEAKKTKKYIENLEEKIEELEERLSNVY